MAGTFSRRSESRICVVSNVRETGIRSFTKLLLERAGGIRMVENRDCNSV